MSERDFYTEVIDLVTEWQEIVEDSDGLPAEAVAALKVAVYGVIEIAEETNPGGYHTEVFNIVQH